MSKNIIFTNISSNIIQEEYYPQPSSKFLPKWYKDSETYLNGEKSPNTRTIKKCIPVFDAISAGYLIFIPIDIYVKNGDFIPSDPSFNLISFHPEKQIKSYMPEQNQPLPKFNNPWSIKTDSGYSCYITQPEYRQLPFEILSGVIDTDIFNGEINLPFSIDINFNGIIPAGTPIAQVIPFKRDSFKYKIGNQNDFENFRKHKSMINSRFFDRYKNMFWSRKEYK